jgi:hypothetical protein
MTKWHWIGLLALGVPGSLLAFTTPIPQENASKEQHDGTVTISLEDCQPAEGKKPKQPGLVQLATTTFGKDEMAKMGRLTVSGRDYAVYLPGAKTYSTKNSGGTGLRLMNTSSVAYVDQNNDGRLSPDEGWNASGPIRIGDQMFEVADLAADGNRLTLRESKLPLGGVVVGRKCPPFSFKAPGGEVFKTDTFAGKAFLLDIWSVT